MAYDHQKGLFAAGRMVDRFESATALKILVGLVGLVIFSAISVIWGQLAGLAPMGEPGSVAANDFSAFWAAGRLGLSEPLAVLDPAKLAAVQNWPGTGTNTEANTGTHTGAQSYFPFAYPPAWLMMMLPLGALPYAAAWPLFVVVGLTAFAASLWAALSSVPSARASLTLAAIAAPVMLFSFVEGQTPLLWLALVLAITTALFAGRPILAGLLCGLVAMKPQLAPLIAIAVVAYALPRPALRLAIPAAFVSYAAVCLLPLLHTGASYWVDWFGAVGDMASRIAVADNAWAAMLPWYAALRVAGIGHGLALALQSGVAVVIAAAIAWLWWRPHIPVFLRLAGLLVAVPLAAPSAWYYEALAFSTAAVFLAAARYDRTALRRLHLILIWALPGYLAPLGQVVPLPFVTAPLATLLLLNILRDAKRGVASE
ncbi:MAG: glycosyltransferase family 87 protein [Pseudomonadota bacterium]